MAILCLFLLYLFYGLKLQSQLASWCLIFFYRLQLNKCICLFFRLSTIKHPPLIFWFCPITSDLSRNHLSGTIPQELGQLKALEVLDLSDNLLNGTVPAELGQLHSLKRLYVHLWSLMYMMLQAIVFITLISVYCSRLLCNNRLEGSIPVEVEKLGLLNNLQCDEVLTTAAAGVGCMNRKFGHW